jgi:rhodanese-related sulfurtransferase
MKNRSRIVFAAALASLLLVSPLVAVPAAAQTPPPTYPHQVDTATVKQFVQQPPQGAMLVDARPAARKYDVGHIPTAVNIPDSQFDSLAPKLLPPDKSRLVIFYCDGPACILSHNSAFKAEKLGYSNVKVYAGGYPEWIKEGNASATRAPAIAAGKEAGSIAVASFERIYREAPDTIHLIDVRDPGEFAAGTFKGATNLPVGALDRSLDKLPADKPIVFFCGAGSRSGEAHDLVKGARPQLKVYFLDAKTTWTADGNYTIAEK